ncbi:MAG: PKD domain-containing protein [Chloroflexi bacterium]|nr:PKD domain-containing protein [Chloroflexota bacterium]
MLGISRIIVSGTTEFTDGKISSQVTHFDTSDPETLTFFEFLQAQGQVDAPTTAPQPTPTAEPVANRPPTADFTFDPLEVPPGDNYTTEFVFTATASDPDDDPLTYQWQFTGGDPNTATGQVVSSFFPGIDDYWITLTVSDGRGEEVTVQKILLLGTGETSGGGLY